ncbi:MAG: hypothetical protein M3Q95_05195 [Bacteroidota bacterium]|nr:hypothetical protein [Bacteroidota bacterium]
MTTQTNFKNQLGNLIHKAETELDELRLKIALGKMNGAELFEDIKKDLREAFHQISSEVQKEGVDVAESVRTNVETLQVQLALGKAEALEAYEEQKTKIADAIKQLEQNVRDSRNALSSESKIKIQNELEKFSLKMEILQIRYELGRLDLKDNVESKKQKFKKEFDELLANVQEETSEKMEAYGTNLKNAYEALRKSLQS